MRMTKLNEPTFGRSKQQSCERNSRGSMFERTTSDDRFQKEGTMHTKRTLRFLVPLMLILSAPVCAGTVHATGEQALKASTSLQFRINIPETVHIRSGTERRVSLRSFTSRSTHAEHDRIVVTVAKP